MKSKSGRILLLVTAAIILVSIIARFTDIMGIGSHRMFLYEGWQYRWGSSPVDSAGSPLWAKGHSGEDWQPMAFSGEPPGRNGQDTLWLKVNIPQGRYHDPALFAKFVRQNFILYIDGQPVYSHGSLPATALERYQPWLPAHFILLPRDFSGGSLVFQISSAYPGMGIFSPVEFASHDELMRNKLSDDLFKIITAAVMMFVSMVVMILYLKNRERKYLFFGSYALLVSLFSFSSTFVKDFFWQSPTFWTIMIPFLLSGLQICWFGFLCTIVEDNRLPVLRRFLWFTIVLLGLSNLVFWYNPLYLPFLIVITMLTALISYAMMWRVLLPRLRHDLTAQIFAAGSTLWIYGYLGDAVILHFFPTIHYTYIAYGQFADAVAMAAILIIQFIHINQKVEQLTRELIEADKRKDEFLAKTSHEIKTPLHGIINITKLFLEQEQRHLGSTQLQNLTLVINIADRLSRLVHDIADITKIKEGTLTIKPEIISVSRHLREVFDICRFVHHDTTNSLEIDVPPDLPCIRADRDRFRQIISNLMDNAVIYTRNGTVSLTARSGGGCIVISITDTGPGIDPQHQDLIFEPFVQLGTEDVPTAGGSGLGLSIVRQLTELQQGTITLDSVPGQGSCFSVTFPIAEGEPCNDPMTPTSELPLKRIGDIELDTSHITNPNGRITLIIADDNHTNLKILIDALEEESYRIIAVTNGQKVLDLVRTEKNVELVILDIMMPDLSGYEVCRILREQYNLAELHILMLTAATQIANAEIALKIGANDFLQKPFLLEELWARVKSLITMKQSASLSAAYEIAFLHAQIKPHFLYNALNTIADYCETDPPAAGRLILSLAKYLRGSLDFANLENTVTAEKELSLVKAYLDIEKARFDNLAIEWDIDEKDLLSVKLPPMTLQTLTENAVKHGILKGRRGGTVTITMKRHSNGITFTVADDGAGLSREQFDKALTVPSGQKSIGLYNINRRLTRLYGSGLSCISKPGQGTVISFTLPVGGVNHAEDSSSR